MVWRLMTQTLLHSRAIILWRAPTLVSGEYGRMWKLQEATKVRRIAQPRTNTQENGTGHPAREDEA